MPQSNLPPLHMGQLHPYEQLIVLVLAFGPFVILGVVVFVVRRRDLAEEERRQATGEGGEPLGWSSSER